MDKVEGIRHWFQSTNPNSITPMIVSETEYAVEWRKTMEQKVNEIVEWISEYENNKELSELRLLERMEKLMEKRYKKKD